MAVLRLPEKHLLNGYVPSCELTGKFSGIQCTHTECWCVDVNYGSEIPGTREAIGMRKPDMCLSKLARVPSATNSGSTVFDCESHKLSD